MHSYLRNTSQRPEKNTKPAPSHHRNQDGNTKRKYRPCPLCYSPHTTTATVAVQPGAM